MSICQSYKSNLISWKSDNFKTTEIEKIVMIWGWSSKKVYFYQSKDIETFIFCFLWLWHFEQYVTMIFSWKNVKHI